MPLSKTEERTLHDSIYVDLLDLKDNIQEIIISGKSTTLIIAALNNAKMNIPKKAVRLIKK
jgi:hypothetical protein